MEAAVKRHRKISSSSPRARVGIGTVIVCARWSRDAGCRGFNGPFPLPLWMSHMQLWSAARGGAWMTTTLRHAAHRFQSRTAVTVDLGAGSRPGGEVRDDGER